MTDAHTPGPWRIEDDPYPHVRTVNGNACVMANDCLLPEDARLIAAAPALLEALRQLLSNAEVARYHLRNDEGGSLIGSALWDTIGQAERAILKATATEQGERG